MPPKLILLVGVNHFHISRITKKAKTIALAFWVLDGGYLAI
jgi:hypothetical protein